MADDKMEARASLNKAKQRKLMEIQDFLRDEIPDSKQRKSGQSAATRFAVNLAYKKLEEIREEKERAQAKYESINHEMEQLAKDV